MVRGSVWFVGGQPSAQFEVLALGNLERPLQLGDCGAVCSLFLVEPARTAPRHIQGLGRYRMTGRAYPHIKAKHGLSVDPAELAGLQQLPRRRPQPTRRCTMIRFLFPRWTARRRYFTTQNHAAEVWKRFSDPSGDAPSRADTLRVLAACERVMADTASGFPGADDRDGDGFTLGQSTGMSALLLEMVADTEVKSHQLHTSMAQPLSGWRSNLDDDPAVAEVLEQLSTETELATRAELTVALYDAVVERVGGQAAEALAVTACSYFELTGLSRQQAMTRVGYASDGGNAS